MRKAAAVAAVLAAAGYTLLAGFAVPAQRTLYMVAVVALALWLDRMQSSSRVLAAALAVVLLLDPWAVVSPGFWLSFGAVALMLYVGSAASGRPHWLAQWGRLQWAITVGLAPLVLLLFQQVSLVSPLANAIAIPVVSLIVTPLALAAAVTPGPWIAEAGHAVLTALMPALDWLARLPGGAWRQHAPAPWTAVLALVGAAWLLAPRGVPARFAAALLFVPLFAVRPAGPADGEIRITFLDVGQGLAVLVRTRGHALLYDAGPAYSVDADAGNRVVVPFLRGEGLDRLDAVVVTHNDADHSGGARSVMRTLPPGVLWSSLARDHPAQGDAPYRLPCRAGVRWTWDGIVFELLHPAGIELPRSLRQGELAQLRAPGERPGRRGAAHRRHRGARRAAAARERGRAARRRAARAAPRQRHLVHAGVPRRGAASARDIHDRLPEPVRPSETGDRGPLSRGGRGRVAHRSRRRGDRHAGDRGGAGCALSRRAAPLLAIGNVRTNGDTTPL